MMRLSDGLAGVRTIGIDSSAFIGFAEARSPWMRVLTRIFDSIDDGQMKGVTTTVTLAEVLYHAKLTGDATQEEAYRTLLSWPGMNLVSVDRAVAEAAADLRVRYNFKTPDALQVATALQAGCQAFLTGDAELARARGDLKILVLGQLTV